MKITIEKIEYLLNVICSIESEAEQMQDHTEDENASNSFRNIQSQALAAMDVIYQYKVENERN